MTHREIGKLLGIPEGTISRLIRQGYVRQEGDQWIVERPAPGRKKGAYGRGLKWEKDTHATT